MKNNEDASANSASFLVRIWKEPGAEGGTSTMRGYFRNLKTGEERYVADPNALLELLQVEPPSTGSIDVSEVRARAARDRQAEASA